MSNELQQKLIASWMWIQFVSARMAGQAVQFDLYVIEITPERGMPIFLVYN